MPPQNKDLSDEDLDKLVYGPPGRRVGPTPVESVKYETGGSQLGRGFAQGIANVVEAPIEAAESGASFLTGSPQSIVPSSLKDLAARFREQAEATPLGTAGEIGGSLMTGEGELAALSRLPGAGRALARWPGSTRAVLGGVQGLWSRPAESPQEAFTQAGTGAVIGGLAGRGIGAAQAAAAANAASKQRAIAAAGTAGQAATEARLAERAIGRSGAGLQRQARAQAISNAEARAVQLAGVSGQAAAEAKLAARAHPELSPEDWTMIGRLGHSLRLTIISALAKHLPAGAIGSSVSTFGGVINKPDQQ